MGLNFGIFHDMYKLALDRQYGTLFTKWTKSSGTLNIRPPINLRMFDACRPPAVGITRFRLTETAEGSGDGVSKIALRDGTFYYVRDKFTDAVSSRVDGKPDWVNATFDRFPIVLKGNGEPWDEVNIWILMRLEGQPHPEMETFLGIAEDMTYYCRFLEEHSLDWLTFPQFKLRRPTYRYNGHLKTRLQLGEISVATAKWRMSRVVNFYRFMMQAGLIALD